MSADPSDQAVRSSKETDMAHSLVQIDETMQINRALQSWDLWRC
jgi:hypothetical protein